MKHFVIMAQIRTGYQFLSSLLHSHPKILSLGEIFVHSEDVRIRSLFGAKIPPYETSADPIRYVEQTLDPYAAKIGAEILGFKLNYTDHVLWDYMKANNWHVIHLTRRNLLDRLISEKLAFQEEKWNFRDYTSKIQISIEELNRYSEDSLLKQAKINEFFNPHPIFYEDLVTQTTTVIADLLEFMGIEQHALTSSMKKQRSGFQAQYVSNYRQLYADLVKTNSPYLKFIDEVPMI